MRTIKLSIGLLLVTAPLAAQSSQFGVRGLGIPMRPYSPRAVATGGAFAMFDAESSLNPAAIASVLQFTSLVSNSQSFRSSTNPFGTASGRDARFPQATVLGPIGGTNLAAALSLSGYTDRSFAIGTTDSITLRGEQVAVFDTLSATGGLSDIRAALAWQVTRSLHVGAAGHLIPGSNRVLNSRAFSDTAYAGATELNELSYLGFGFSTGIVARPVARVAIAGLFRVDGSLTTRRDSTDIGSIDLPTTLGGAIRWQPSLRLVMAGSVLRRNWSVSDADLRAQGGVGALNTTEIAAGVELIRNNRNPAHKAIRFGAHYATLPFPVTEAIQPHEVGLSLGTGIRFTGGRGGFDIALEQLWRSDSEGFSERAFVITLGVSLRP